MITGTLQPAVTSFAAAARLAARLQCYCCVIAQVPVCLRVCASVCLRLCVPVSVRSAERGACSEQAIRSAHGTSQRCACLCLFGRSEVSLVLSSQAEYVALQAYISQLFRISLTCRVYVYFVIFTGCM